MGNINFCLCTVNFIAFLLQFYLASIPGQISDRVKSAAVPYVRPVSQGYQSYDTVKSEYPITEPLTKLTANLQVCMLVCGKL